MDHYLFFDASHVATARRLTELGAIDSMVEFFSGEYAGVAVWHGLPTNSARSSTDPICVQVIDGLCIKLPGEGDTPASKWIVPADWCIAWLIVHPTYGVIEEYCAGVAVEPDALDAGGGIIGVTRFASPRPGVLIEVAYPQFGALQSRVTGLLDSSAVASASVMMATGADKRARPDFEEMIARRPARAGRSTAAKAAKSVKAATSAKRTPRAGRK